MKTPCEIFVSIILPIARVEVAKQLISRYGYNQSRVAETFGVTYSAVSQYIRGVRGVSKLIGNSDFYDSFMDAVRTTTDDIARGVDVHEAFCRICDHSRESGLIKAIIKLEGYAMEAIPECPLVEFRPES
jgi:hypothetical protein